MLTTILLASLTGGFFTLFIPVLAIFGLLIMIGKPKSESRANELELEKSSLEAQVKKLQDLLSKEQAKNKNASQEAKNAK